jgi:hypothetical protein
MFGLHYDGLQELDWRVEQHPPRQSGTCWRSAGGCCSVKARTPVKARGRTARGDARGDGTAN